MAFEERMAELKKPMEMGDYGTEEVRDLENAIDILQELQAEFAREGKMVDLGFEKLGRARDCLNKLPGEHLEEPDKQEESK